jgi:hypothetical protein
LASQDGELLRGQLEHEVFREAIPITLHRANERSRCDLVQLGQVGVEDHRLIANDVDGAVDPLGGNERLFRWHGITPPEFAAE